MLPVNVTNKQQSGYSIVTGGIVEKRIAVAVYSKTKSTKYPASNTLYRENYHVWSKGKFNPDQGIPAYTRGTARLF